jgi:aminoglycoside phosphotransferase (APT) family kinase protein
VAVPRFELVWDDEELFAAGYRKLRGDRLDRAVAGGVDAAGIAAGIGAFLAALHSFDIRRAEALGVPPATVESLTADLGSELELYRTAVLPLLDRTEQEQARRLLDAWFDAHQELRVALTHGDMTPEHILCAGDGVAGVIDWGEVKLGDPGNDLGWVLNGLGPSFADLVLDAYRSHGGHADDRLRTRVGLNYRLGPWSEVLYGLDAGGDTFVRSGLEAVRRRLPSELPEGRTGAYPSPK